MTNEENKREMDGGEIDLIALMYALLKKWWLLLIGFVVGGAVFFIVTWQLIKPTYQSSATLYMVASTVTINSVSDLQLGTELAEDFGKIVTSKTVADRTVERLKREKGKSFTRGQILEMLTVTNTATRMMTLTTVAEDPVDACDVANAVAEEAIIRIEEITKSDPPSVMEKAEVSTVPIGPNTKKNTILGCLAGFVLAAGYVVLKHLMNDNIRTEEDIERALGLKTLVVIPMEKPSRKQRTESSVNTESGVNEEK